MSEMIQAGFDYGALPAESAIVARTAAERIRLRLKRTVEDIIEIGRELTEVKAELPHGQFLPWIEAEFEMTARTAQSFMDVYDRFGGKNEIISFFKPTILYALAAPSTPDSVVEKAIAKAESGENVAIAEVKQWKKAAQAAEQRAEEFRIESNSRRKTIRELETQIDLLKSAPPEIQIQTPADYEATKAKAAKLEIALADIKKQQAALVQKQVADKLKERAEELEKIDKEVSERESKLAGLKQQIDRYSLQQRELKVHLDTIEASRTAMAILAANLEGFEAVIDHDNELRLWRALSQMLRNGAEAIDFFVGDAKPRLVA